MAAPIECQHYSVTSPFFPSLHEYYDSDNPNRKCYSAPGSSAMNGAWLKTTCPNCRSALQRRTRKHKKEAKALIRDEAIRSRTILETGQQLLQELRVYRSAPAPAAVTVAPAPAAAPAPASARAAPAPPLAAPAHDVPAGAVAPVLSPAPAIVPSVHASEAQQQQRSFERIFCTAHAKI